ADEAATAAAAMRMTAAEQQALGVVDTVVEEPGGGAHTAPRETARRVEAPTTNHANPARRLKPIIVAELDRLSRMAPGDLVEARYHRFRDLGPYTELAAEPAPPLHRQGAGEPRRNTV